MNERFGKEFEVYFASMCNVQNSFLLRFREQLFKTTSCSKKRILLCKPNGSVRYGETYPLWYLP